MIEIELRLFGGLERYLKDSYRNEKGVFHVIEDSTVEDLLTGLEIESEEYKIILVNGRPGDSGDVLRKLDRVAIFPAIIGG